MLALLHLGAQVEANWALEPVLVQLALSVAAEWVEQMLSGCWIAAAPFAYRADLAAASIAHKLDLCVVNWSVDTDALHLAVEKVECVIALDPKVALVVLPTSILGHKEIAVHTHARAVSEQV